MLDDFDSWNNRKKHIETIECDKIVFSEREIWWCSLGKNVGDEENGKNILFERPVLVLKKFSRRTLIVLPLTTKGKLGSVFYHKLVTKEESYVIISQVRLISTKRLLRKMYRMGRTEFGVIKDKVSKLIC